MEKDKYLQQLAEKWKNGTISPAEQLEFNQWYDAFDDSMLEDPETKESAAELKDRLYARILSRENIATAAEHAAQHHDAKVLPMPKAAKPISFWISIAAAAAIFIAIAAALIFLPPPKNNTVNTLAQNQAHDLKPGGQIATLTLADGHTVSLNQLKTAELIEQTGISIHKSKEGVLVYRVKNGKSAALTPEFNTLSTPIGGTYQIELPDGSKVWLNAASSIRFPASFEGLKERKVELKGEAYFEVAKDKTKPFKVSRNQQEVEVLGTHFNVNAYSNEGPIKTTLLEGSVSLHLSNGPSAKLQPGEQAVFKDGKWNIKAVNAADVIAWQKGNFVFNDEELSSILRQLERWYGVQVDYSQVPDRKFSGVISKNVYLSKVLKMLELAGDVHLNLEGNTIKAAK
ncbi:FecR domain-containing protein [Pedobacter gandavensis]|uniref:FecR family protein n=1 Tax=Pedobacter gandavensis TaxID=2679963 RepID=UPI002478FF65|nr:FecR family protein [Pedobacter gandavensis]WGQ11832.1 FecR domain-containing protein [Pedobacter gandavensis]